VVGWVDAEEMEEEDRRHGFMQTSRKGVDRALAHSRVGVACCRGSTDLGYRRGAALRREVAQGTDGHLVKNNGVPWLVRSLGSCRKWWLSERMSRGCRGNGLKMRKAPSCSRSCGVDRQLMPSQLRSVRSMGVDDEHHV
jgi:hypothetical protein